MYLQNCLTPFVNKVLSDFVFAYRKSFCSDHVLIRPMLIEDRKKSLDDKNYVGAVLMNFSKAFDCIPHDLLIAKMSADEFPMDTLFFMYCYLKRRKQNVKINNIENLLKNISFCSTTRLNIRSDTIQFIYDNTIYSQKSESDV